MKEVSTLFPCKQCKSLIPVTLARPKFGCVVKMNVDCLNCGQEHELYLKMKPKSRGKEVDCEARFKLPVKKPGLTVVENEPKRET